MDYRLVRHTFAFTITSKSRLTNTAIRIQSKVRNAGTVVLTGTLLARRLRGEEKVFATCYEIYS